MTNQCRFRRLGESSRELTPIEVRLRGPRVRVTSLQAHVVKREHVGEDPAVGEPTEAIPIVEHLGHHKPLVQFPRNRSHT
jgi:hypothetical protein